MVQHSREMEAPEVVAMIASGSTSNDKVGDITLRVSLSETILVMI